MGVHDYRCAVCGEPQGYRCAEGDGGEAEGGECEVVGFGEDQAWLALFWFPAARAPRRPADLPARRSACVKAQVRRFGFDWSAWDFEPSLNYRGLLMRGRDASGVWELVPPDDDDLDEENPVSLAIPAGLRVWAVNFCPACRARFLQGKRPARPPCRLYLEAIAAQLGLRYRAGRDDRQEFLARVQARVDDLLPLPAPEPARGGPAPRPARGVRRLELRRGTSAKFWEVAVRGSACVVRWGRLGSAGQTRTRQLATAALVRAEAEKLAAAKQKKGYQPA